MNIASSRFLFDDVIRRQYAGGWLGGRRVPQLGDSEGREPPRKERNVLGGTHYSCYTTVLPGRKPAFRAGFWPDCYRANTQIGLLPVGGPILKISR